MGGLFDAISAGFARFVFAWITPSVLSLGLFCIFVLPGVDDLWVLEPIVAPAERSGFTAAIVFTLFVLGASALFAYASVPIYQVLEGYLLPKHLREALRSRHLIRYQEHLMARHAFEQTGRLPPGFTTDDLWMRYPPDRASVRATALGNALTAMEHWSVHRYGIDSQTMWHELHAVSDDHTRKSIDEGRAPVDFFVSSIANLVPLSIVALIVGLATSQRQALLVTILGAIAIPLAYRMAVKNVVDWAQAVKAMVNLGRVPLASRLHLRMPETLGQEKSMWSAHLYTIELADHRWLEEYDSYRGITPRPASILRSLSATARGQARAVRRIIFDRPAKS